MTIDTTLNTSTFDKNSLIDWCMHNNQINRSHIKCNVYESYFSDHKPLFVELLKNK